LASHEALEQLPRILRTQLRTYRTIEARLLQLTEVMPSSDCMQSLHVTVDYEPFKGAPPAFLVASVSFDDHLDPRIIE
jgi:hypothetical protein